MKLAIVEISAGYVLEIGETEDFDMLRKKVEKDEPWRWHNPILVVVQNEVQLETDREEEANKIEQYDMYGKPFGAEIVVAVPSKEIGYGTVIAGRVEENRRRFGLLT